MEKTNRIILCALDTGEEKYSLDSSLSELAELAENAKGEVVAVVTQKREKPDPAYAFGAGKVAEIKELAEKLSADLLIYDGELAPTKIRNIEKAADCRVIDRTMLILDIFASRAVTAEGKLQTELAQLEYLLPRLTGAGISLSRLGGGIGTRGPGESQLETDKRHIRRRITKLKEELREVAARRQLHRVRRRKDGRTAVAIVGYTNAGKSTLLNALTKADAYAADMLFATLDTTTRKLRLAGGREVFLTDTVGFIRRLPHKLVEAFKSTLEEAAVSDLILHVYDGADTEAAEKIAAAAAVLDELGAGGIPTILVCNKCDKLTGAAPAARSIKISAKTKDGIDTLLKAITEKLG